MTLYRITHDEYRKLAWRFVQAGQFQTRILRKPARSLGFERARIAALEFLPHAGPTGSIINSHETPWLAQTDRWRAVGQSEQLIQHPLRNPLRIKMPNVPPPDEELGELVAESGVEPRFRRG